MDGAVTPATGGDAPQKCEPAVRQMSFAGAVLQRSPSESNLTPKKSCKQSPTPPSLTRMPSRSRIQPEMSKWEMYMLEQSISPDPAARYVPLYGKLLWTYGLLFVCLFLMIASCIVGKGIVSLRENPLLGPSPETLRIMGGLNTYAVRHGEWWRLIWAPFLHAGWFHILMNFALWYQLGVMIEPDWGFFRTGLVFMISALSGTLMSATLSPRTEELEQWSVSVGASGGIFGMMGGCVPYVIEYWTTIPQPKCMLYIVIVSLVVGLVTGFLPFVDNYAHIGGALGGILGGFLTVTKIEVGREAPKENSYWRSQTLEQLRYQRARSKSDLLNRPSRYTRVDAVTIIRVPQEPVVQKEQQADKGTQFPQLPSAVPEPPQLAEPEQPVLPTAPNLSHDGVPPLDELKPVALSENQLVPTEEVVNDDASAKVLPAKEEACVHEPSASNATTSYNHLSHSLSHERHQQHQFYDLQRSSERLHASDYPSLYQDAVTDVAVDDPSYAQQHSWNEQHPLVSAVSRESFGKPQENENLPVPQSSKDYEFTEAVPPTFSNAVLHSCPPNASFSLRQDLPYSERHQRSDDSVLQLQSVRCFSGCEEQNCRIPIAENVFVEDPRRFSSQKQCPEACPYNQDFTVLELRERCWSEETFLQSNKSSLSNCDRLRRFEEFKSFELEETSVAPRFQRTPCVASAALHPLGEAPVHQPPELVGDTQPCTSTTNVFMTNGDAATSSTDVPTSSTVRRFRVNFQQPYEREPSSSLNQFPQRPATSQSLVAKKKTVWSAVSSYFKNPYRPREEQRLKVPSRMTLRCTENEDVDDSFKWASRTVWVVRFASACFLFILWYSLFYFLLVCPKCYTPPGSISFFS